MCVCFLFFFFQAEDGKRDLERYRGLGDVKKRQTLKEKAKRSGQTKEDAVAEDGVAKMGCNSCLLYTSDAAYDLTRVVLRCPFCITQPSMYQVFGILLV